MSLPMRLVLVTVAILGLWPRDNAAKGRPADPLGRLMGPFASLLASAEWVRFDLALYEGRPEAAYAHAERALDLDPGAVAGWQYLAHHLIFERGSELEAGSPDERRAWIQAGIERLEEGSQHVDSPADLFLIQALAWSWVAEQDQAGGLDWPGGASLARERSNRALNRAAELGHPGADRMLAGQDDR